jgi:HEPN domain-containing protein
MPPDPERAAESRAWLERARADLEAAGILLAAPGPRPDVALFHCQQTVEKAWKAFLSLHGSPFRRTHDLRELGKAAARLDGSLAGLAVRAEDLTVFAWVFRYPGELEVPPVAEGEEALELAREVYEAVQARLEKEAQL